MTRTNQLILGAAVLGSTLLAGCSSNAKIDQLSSDVQTLSAKVEQQIGMSVVCCEGYCVTRVCPSSPTKPF